MATITNAQILALRNEAATAGDLRMAMICELAIAGEYGWAEPGTEMDTLRREGMTQEQALAECERVIADAAAMGD